jgi:hypothetical protein
MFRSKIALGLLALGAAAGMMQPAAAQAPIAVDPSNTQFFNYNGATISLVGQSGEFLPHVSNSALKNKECTFDVVSTSPTTLYSYQKCFNELNQDGLNVTQLWVSLNSSPGSSNRPVTPLPNEQPFIFDAATARWKLGAPFNTTFFNNLRTVIQYAYSKGIIVEVNLIDPWGGDDLGATGTSPWNPLNNCGSTNVCPTLSTMSSNTSFTETRYVVSYQRSSGMNDTVGSIANARAKQMALVAHIVQQTRDFPNVIYQIANEADLVPPDSGKTPPDLDAMMDWHTAVANQIAANDSANPHLVSVNFLTKTSIDEVILRMGLPLGHADKLAANIKLINGHYVESVRPDGEGAMELIRNHAVSIPLGFNEGRATPDPMIVGARAEAWEFVMNQGALYDNYNLDMFTPASDAVRTYLKRLRSFVAPFNLSFVSARQSGSSPVWATGLVTPGTATAQDVSPGRTYWSGFQATRQWYGLYIHHSCQPDGPDLRRYKPVCKATGYQNTLTLHLGSVTKSFKVDWMTPDSDTPICSQVVNWIGGSAGTTVTSPKYPYDLGMRITVCTAGVDCPATTNCSSAPVSLTCPLTAWPDSFSCPSP